MSGISGSTGSFEVLFHVDESEWNELESLLASASPSTTSDRTNAAFYYHLDCAITVMVNGVVIHGPSPERLVEPGQGTTPLLYLAYVLDGFLASPSYPTTLDSFDGSLEFHLRRLNSDTVEIIDPSHGVTSVGEGEFLDALRAFLANVTANVSNRVPGILEWESCQFLKSWLAPSD